MPWALPKAGVEDPEAGLFPLGKTRPRRSAELCPAPSHVISRISRGARAGALPLCSGANGFLSSVGPELVCLARLVTQEVAFINQCLSKVEPTWLTVRHSDSGKLVQSLS